jgi:hypothetical protein
MHRSRLSHQLGRFLLKDVAPVVAGIRVADPNGNEHSALWDGLIDTGSPFTVIPHQIAADLQMTASGNRPLAWFGHLGAARSYSEYDIRLSIPGLPAPVSLAACGVPGRKYILLGRDFINQHVLLIDGRAGAWGISRPTAFLRMAMWCLGVRR